MITFNNVLIIFSVDVSCGLMALHIGDRILEINGTPIKDQPISQIEHLICYSDTVLQVNYIILKPIVIISPFILYKDFIFLAYN